LAISTEPLIEIISALGDTGFYKRPPHIPHMLYIPIFGETLIDMEFKRLAT
jgi:hypothetical protein